MEAKEPLPEDSDRVKQNLEDDVRSFLLSRLPWKRMTEDQRNHLRYVGLDKQLRRPTFIQITAVDDDVDMLDSDECSVGAEGVLAHEDEDCIHLAFKCSNPDHQLHYSTFGIDTIITMAKACEAAWPGSVSEAILEEDLSLDGGMLSPEDLLDALDAIEEANDDDIELGHLDDITDDDFSDF